MCESSSPATSAVIAPAAPRVVKAPRLPTATVSQTWDRERFYEFVETTTRQDGADGEDDGSDLRIVNELAIS